MPGLDAAESFLNALNGLHPSIHFTVELSNNDSIPFIGTLITRNGNKLDTQVYRKHIYLSTPGVQKTGDV